MANIQAQSDEIEALLSIYDRDVLNLDRNKTYPYGRFLAHLYLPKPFQVTFNEGISLGTAVHGCKDIIRQSHLKEESNAKSLDYLPPISLTFELPPTYPSHTPPAFLLKCQWLTLDQLSSLCRKLEMLWKEVKGEVLFSWFQFLQSDSLVYLKIGSTFDLSSVIRQHVELISQSENSILKTKLKNQTYKPLNEDLSRISSNNENSLHNAHSSQMTESLEDTFYKRIVETRSKKSETFRDEHFSLSQKQSKPRINGGNRYYDQRASLDLSAGMNLMSALLESNHLKKKEEFNKEHFFCNICFVQKKGIHCITFSTCNHVFCQKCIRSYFEIQIRNGISHYLTCPESKCESQALPSQIRELVSEELYLIYDARLLAVAIDCMSDVVYCPRSFCQSATIAEPNSTMASCPRCTYVFCIICKKSYHGVEPCNIKLDEKKEICSLYLKAKEQEKMEMERKYGRRFLRMMVDDILADKWINDCSKKCPRCRTNIEKIDGCNKMTCWRCKTSFCWLCMKKLDIKGYDHFNDLNSDCFDKLFHGLVEVDEEDTPEFGEYL